MGINSSPAVERRVPHRCCAAGLLLLLWIAPEHGTEDGTRYRFDHLGEQQGLSHSVVNAVLQDRVGFMWFGTTNGLNKYDGNVLIAYEHVPGDSSSLSDNWITALLEDASGNLWVGTRHGGLNRFDRNTERFDRYPYHACARDMCDRPDGLNGPVITSLLQDRSGMIWVGTYGGLSRFDPATGRFEHFRHDPVVERSLSSDQVWCLAEDRDGFIWAGTWESGLNRVDPRSGSITRFRVGKGDGLSGERVRAVMEDRNGNLWIGVSGGGVNRLDRESGRIDVILRSTDLRTGLPDNRVWSLFEDSRGVLWFGTYEGGLTRFDPETREFRHFAPDPDDPSSLASSSILDLYEDRSGILWIAGDAGVSRFHLAQERHVHYAHDPGRPNSLSDDDVLAVYQSRSEPGLVWIGTRGGGINRFDLTSGTFRRVTPNGSPGRRLRNDVITSVVEDQDANLWIGTNAGVHVMHAESGKIDVYRHDPGDPSSLGNDMVSEVYVDAGNSVWVATDAGGLNRFNPASGRFTRYQRDPTDPSAISDNSIRAIFEDSRGNLWLGTAHSGLSRFDRESASFVSYRNVPGDPHSLSHDRVTAIHEDDSGYLWIATYGGLNRLDPSTGRFKLYTWEDGLPVEPYIAIAGDEDGGLWLTTAGWLTRFRPDTGTARYYTDRSGLSPNQYNPRTLLRTSTGELILGGKNGFSRFRPPPAEADAHEPPTVVVTAFRKMDELVTREVFSGETLSLLHSDRFFSLEFAVLDYTNPAKHRYQFRLDGYDTEWHHATGSIGRAAYANFRPIRSEYVFQLRASDSQGAWNVMSIRIQVIPPWWQTLWFRVSAVLLAGLIAGSVVTHRHQRKKRERAETLRLLTEGRERERHFLARELHDSPLQNLYQIRHKLQVISRNPLGSEAKKVLDEMNGILEKTSDDLRVLCGDLRPPSLGPFGLAKAIRVHVEHIQRTHPEIAVTLDLASDGQILPEHLRHSLFRIYQNAVSNVLRHARARNLWVTFELHDGRVVLEVKDDGRGFDVPKSWLTLARSRHFGLLGISEWAEAIEADLHVDSAPGRGTTLRVAAPRPR